jgi:GMP synthase (glutamine-hydrolysing)
MDKILILDFGSQYTQLIARRVRELNVFCEISPCTKIPAQNPEIKGIILSGSPWSVHAPGAPMPDLSNWYGQIPILGVCYGAQMMSVLFGGKVERSEKREYGNAKLVLKSNSALFEGVSSSETVWMSHGDHIESLPEGFTLTAGTESVAIAAFENVSKQMYALQFHPEVTHSIPGKQILSNFILNICKIKPDWTPAHFIDSTVANLKDKLRGKKVICGLSGGVDSTVAATLIHKAIGSDLYCIFVDNGLLRKDEFSQVLEQYKHLGLNIIPVNASERFLTELKDVTDPEEKRKIIGKVFIDVFQDEGNKINGVDFLAQGTIYPDVIESISVNGPSATIKSHHNVGGLPDTMHLQVVEPLRMLFKDEVRRVGTELGISNLLTGRHPFPGPGLAIRIIGSLDSAKLNVLRDADEIFIEGLKEFGLYNSVWQAFVVLLPVSSVGVMGDERTYENVVALRAVTSVDGMTADWAKLPHEFLGEISSRIINRVKGVNRVVYDISSKPPATIEWE